MTPSQIEVIVPLCGFGLAFVFGVVAQRSSFCTMGAVSDAVNFGDTSRLRMWFTAIAAAIIGAQTLHLLGWVDLSKSMYPGPRFTWLAYLVGGALFGVGMTIASGCGSRNVLRLGAGNLKSLIVLVALAISAYMTLKGLLAPVRVYGLEVPHINFAVGQDLPALLGQGSRAWIAVAIAMAILVWAFSNRDFRANGVYWIGGLIIGLIVVAGWYVTGNLGYLPEHPDTLEAVYVGTSTRRPESFTYVAPVAFSLELLMLWTDASLRITFGIAIVFGALVGSLAHALITHSFRWESFASPRDLVAHVAGGVLMGFGGVTALGCTIGQGITGVSTLALGSFLALGAMIAASAATMKFIYARSAGI